MLKNLRKIKTRLKGRKKIISSRTYKYLNRPKDEILAVFGLPQDHSDPEILFYNRSRYFFFRDEISFYLERGKVNKIGVTQYFLHWGINDVVFKKSGTYSVVNLIRNKVSQN